MSKALARFRKPWGIARMTCLGLFVGVAFGCVRGLAQEPPVTNGVESVRAAKEATAPVTGAGHVSREKLDYTVSPEDTLEVLIMDVPEVSRAYRVGNNGLLSMPLLPEPIQAAGLTLDQLSHVIATKFREAGMLNNAQVTVSLRETRLHSVIISGSVKKPQAYPVYGPTRLLDLLTQAGGLADDAGNEVVVTRGPAGLLAQQHGDTTAAEESGVGDDSHDSKDATFTLDIKKLLETGEDASNILLYAGDRVTVPRAALIYILGAVNRPGGYTLHDPHQQITVLKALAMAGDVSSLAKKKHMVILRKDPANPDAKRTEIRVDFDGLVHARIADVNLQAEDILYVPVSGRQKALQQALSSGVTTGSAVAAGLIVYH